MLRMYVMDKPSKWEYYLHLVELSYNKNFQVFVGMSPFDMDASVILQFHGAVQLIG